MDDETLVRQANLGHEKAIVDLYQRYVKIVYRYFYYQTNLSKEIAEDLTSQTFLELIRSLKKFEFRGSFKGYLFGIAKRELLDYIRLKYKEPTLPLFESLAIGQEIFDEEEMEKKINQIEQVLGTLKEKENTAIKMRYLEGASSQEVADKLGVSLSNAKVIVHRALKKLSSNKM